MRFHLSILYLTSITLVSGKYVRQTADAKAELENYIEKARDDVNPRYRLTYHVAAPVGWINDPNGFSFYQGQYHLFYQYYPYDSVWGPMHWGHVVSTDLVNWEYLPTALLPEDEQCFSGSAIEHDGKLYIIYTAHKITSTDPYFNQTQYLAYSEDGVDFTKYEGNPVIATAPNGSPDFRDPKIWKHGDYFYVVIGSATTDDRGRVLLYRSENLVKWEFLTVLAESTGDLGYMWECPDFFELNGKHVLLMSPQGVEVQGDRFKNLHQTGYIVGKLDYDTFEFIIEKEFVELDLGHDFYAAQTMERDGRRQLIGWFGMWESPHYEDEDGWANAMTIVRELTIDENNHIFMNPVEDIKSLREETIVLGTFDANQAVKLGSAAEILIDDDFNNDIEFVFEGAEAGQRLWVRWNKDTRNIIVDRDGDVRQVEWIPKSSYHLRIFVDTSSVEIFCGDGEVVFSTRVYPVGEWIITNIGQQSLSVEIYSLKRSVPI